MKARKKLRGNIPDMIEDMGEGNIGAFSVLMDIAKNDPTSILGSILHLDDMNIRGEQIWVGYKYYSGCDLVKFIESIKKRDKNMVDRINKECLYDNFKEKAVEYGASFSHSRE